MVAGLLALLACAILPAGASAAKKPIVYVIVIDGLDGDAVEAGNAPFISSLYEGTATDGSGAYFPGSRSVIPAETNPNHTAMMTGALPGKSGIAANAFAVYGDLVNEDSCETTGPLDYSMIPATTSGESPTCPKAETIFESVRRQAGNKHPVTSVVMGKPKLGRIFDVTYKGERAADAIWAPCDDTPEDDEYCADVPTNPVTGYAQNDTVVMDEVVGQIDGVTVGGEEKRADFTFVNLPQVDTIGHALGRGPIYDNAVGTADGQIERLADALKASGEWERTSIIVTSDHSMDTTPVKTSMTQAIEGAGVSSDDFTVVQNGSVDFVYLANRKAPKEERDALLEADARRDARSNGCERGALPARQRCGRRQGEQGEDAPSGLEYGQTDRRHHRDDRAWRCFLRARPVWQPASGQPRRPSDRGQLHGRDRRLSGHQDSRRRRRVEEGTHSEQRHRRHGHAPVRPQATEGQRGQADQGSVR